MDCVGSRIWFIDIYIYIYIIVLVIRMWLDLLVYSYSFFCLFAWRIYGLNNRVVYRPILLMRSKCLLADAGTGASGNWPTESADVTDILPKRYV